MSILISCEQDEVTEINCSESGLSLAAIGISTATCLEKGKVSLEATGGQTPYQFSVDGFSFMSENDFTELNAGSYIGTVEDANNCETSVSFVIPVEQGAVVFSLMQNELSGCETGLGQVSVEASGGVGNLMYSIDGSDFGDSNVFDGLDQGNHSFSVLDEQGCETTKDIFVLSGISYKDEIEDIIINNCAITECHTSSTSLLDLAIFENIQNNAQSIKSLTQNGSMPKGDDKILTQEEIDLIACWVNDGALNN